MKFIKKIDDTYIRDRIPVIYMAEAVTNIRSPWRTRALDWIRRRVPSWRRRSAVRERRSYPFSPSRRSRARPAVLRIGRDQNNLWIGLSHRYNSLLGRARSFTDAPPDIFQSRFLLGMGRLVGDPFQLMNRGLSLDNALLFYQYGKLCEPQYGFHPQVHKTTERFLREQSSLEYLIQGQNLRSFMYTLDILFSQARKQHETQIKQLKDEQQFTATVNFLNITMRVTFEKQRIAAVEIEATKARMGKRAHLQFMVDYGYIIEQTRKAINSRSESSISTVVLRNDGMEVVKEVLKASPAESLPTLIEAAVDLTTKQKGEDVINRAILLAAYVLMTNPEMIPAMVTELKSTYHNSFIKGAQTEADLARVKILSRILENTPAALPHSLNEHDKHYSWFSTKNLAAQVFDPIAVEIAKNREGEDAILAHAYNIASKIPERIYDQIKKFKLAKGKLGRSLALQTARHALNITSKKVPVFAEKTQTDELRQIIHALANSSLYQREADTLTVKEARSLIFVAVKLQAIMEFLRNNETNKALLAHAHLDQIDGIHEIAGIRIPFINNLSGYITERGNEIFGAHSHRNADAFTEYLITRDARGNIFSAQRAIELLKGNDQAVWNMIPSPINEAAHRNDPNYSLPLVTFFTRYAYSFLSANWMQPRNSENKIRDINSTLKADTDHKQLFLTLRSIPPAIKKEQLRNFVRLIEEAGYPKLAAKILAEHA